MQLTHLRLENWRNFKEVDVELQRRVFVIGPNASGKSNLLDALRFLRDVAEPEGGLQRAVAARDGVKQLRCLHARRHSNVAIEVAAEYEDIQWSYRLEFGMDNNQRPRVKGEHVHKNGEVLLARPDADDDDDPVRLTQTHLEQVNENKAFRPLARFLSEVRYQHIIPQLIRDPARSVQVANDPFGSDFLEQLARTRSQTLKARLKRINHALQVAVPTLEELKLERDAGGAPHLMGRYKHWRPNAGWQSEEHLSDGTLRLLGLLWSLLDGKGPLLLEEPELSLHVGIVRHLPAMMHRVTRKRPRQILVSTHSADLLDDESIAPEEVLLLEPSAEGTTVSAAADDPQIRALYAGGSTIGEAAFPRTTPMNAVQLALWG